MKTRKHHLLSVFLSDDFFLSGDFFLNVSVFFPLYVSFLTIAVCVLSEKAARY